MPREDHISLVYRMTMGDPPFTSFLELLEDMERFTDSFTESAGAASRNTKQQPDSSVRMASRSAGIAASTASLPRSTTVPSPLNSGKAQGLLNMKALGLIDVAVQQIASSLSQESRMTKIIESTEMKEPASSTLMHPFALLIPPSPQPNEAALHLACQNPSTTPDQVNRLVRADPTAVCRSLSLSTVKMAFNARKGRVETRRVKEMYTYPLHLAIRNKLSARVIEMLTDVSGPHMLLQRDGWEQDTPLHVLLQTSPNDVATADMLMLKNPECLGIMNRTANLPLHVACCRPVAMEIVRHLCILYPLALKVRNLNGLTPLQLARHRTSSSDELINFLLERHEWMDRANI